MSRPYYDKGGISTYDFIKAKNMNFAEGCVIKYVTRWRFKDGVADLHKAKWYLEALIEEAEHDTRRPGHFGADDLRGSEEPALSGAEGRSPCDHQSDDEVP